MALTVTADLSDLFQNIIQEAIFTAQEKSLVRNFVSVLDISGTSGNTVQIPIYPNVAASAIAEGTDLASTAIATSSVTVAVGEVGVQAVLTDLAAKTAMGDTAGQIGRVLGEAVAKKMDQDLIGLFTGFTAGFGSAGAEITPAMIFKAAATLRNNNAEGNPVCILHPYQAYQLKSELTNAFSNPNAGEIQSSAMKTGYVGMLGGVSIYESSNIAVDAEDDAIGCVFIPSAMGLAVKWDVNIEPQRDASLRAWELNATSAYGAGMLLDVNGVKLTSDASLA